MKKSINNFSVALGLLSIIYAMLIVPEIIEMVRQPHTLQAVSQPSNSTYIGSFLARDILAAFRSTIYASGMLMGLAVLIELVDRIRVSVAQKEDKKP
ncbi:MAG: hypothetical protein ABSC92_12980 [Rhizomicrobium sp.]|jgi:ABC-type sulfate transport system permease component